MFIIFHSFCGSGIWDQLGWAALAYVPEVAGKPTSKVAYPHGWQVDVAANEVLLLYLHMGFSTRLFECHDAIASFPQYKQRDEGRSCSVFCDLASGHIPSLFH